MDQSDNTDKTVFMLLGQVITPCSNLVNMHRAMFSYHTGVWFCRDSFGRSWTRRGFVSMGRLDNIFVVVQSIGFDDDDQAAHLDCCKSSCGSRAQFGTGLSFGSQNRDPPMVQLLRLPVISHEHLQSQQRPLAPKLKVAWFFRVSQPGLSFSHSSSCSGRKGDSHAGPTHQFSPQQNKSCLRVSPLCLFNAKLYPLRYWSGPRPTEQRFSYSLSALNLSV